MKKIENDWKLQSLPFGEEMKDALQQQHHAAQYIALVGKHLIPQQADDSNTNMEFVPEKGILLGNALPNGIKVGLQLNHLQIILYSDRNRILKTLSLNGKTKAEGFSALKESLSSLGIDTSAFTNELHYEIPSHPLDKGAVFSVKDEKYFIENLKYRHNANMILSEIAAHMEHAESVKIWPHHFDTGSFVLFAKNKKGAVSQTIGLGLAIPDSMVPEPYYYLSFWSEKDLPLPKKIPPPGKGRWMMPQWNGAVIDHTAIHSQKSALGQYKLVQSFYKEGIHTIIELLKNS